MRRQIFLSELMPLGVCMKFLGWFPTQRTITSGGDPTTELKLMSVNAVYSVLVTSLQLVNIVLQSVRGLKLIPTKPPEQHVHAYYNLLFRATPHFVPLFIILQCRKQITFTEEFMQLQNQVERHSISGKPINLGHMRRRLAIKVTIIVSIGITLLTIRCFRLHRFLLEDIFLILGFVNEAFLLTWWHYAAVYMKLISSHILREYQLLLEFNEDGKYGQLLARAVLDLRSPWLKLNILMRDSGDVLSAALINLFLSNFMRLLATTYLMCRISDVRSISFNVITFIISGSILVLVCQTTHEIQRELYLNILKALEDTPKLRIGSKPRAIITNFLVHLSRNPPQVTYNGYFNVGRPLLTTILSSFIAYITVILQLSQHEPTITYEDVVQLYDYFYTNPYNATH